MTAFEMGGYEMCRRACDLERALTARRGTRFAASVRAVALTVLLSTAIAPAALAQESTGEPRPSPAWVQTDRRVTELPRLSAKQLLGAQGVTTSFAALKAILKPGQEVVFARRGTSRLATAFQSGGLWSGRKALVAEVSSDRLVLVRRRFFRTQEIVFTEDAVRRIDIVDSNRKGALLGAVVGGFLGTTAILQTRREGRGADCNLCPLGYIMGALMPVIGSGVGASIDRAITEPIYERQPHARRVALTPQFGRSAIGASAHVRF